MEGLTSAMRSKSCMMLPSSVWFVLRNLRRAGTLKKRLLTSKLAPTGHEHTSCPTKREPSMQSRTPSSWSAVRVVRRTCATAAMEASASPRKPMVWSLKRSSACRILDVAWRSKAMRASVSLIPLPSSMTWMDVRPASCTSTSMVDAPASTAFSISSLMTDAGRCTTSPAAIWLATESGRRCMMSTLLVLFWSDWRCRREQGVSSQLREQEAPYYQQPEDEQYD